MATINLGAIKFNWKGAYNNGTTYAVDDVVSSGGNSYVCIQASTGNAVGNATAYWNIMATKGTDGADADLLSIGSTAQGDLYYNSGGAIARLGAGTSGQYLKTQGTGANPVWGTVSAGTYSVHAISKYNYQTQTMGPSSNADYVDISGGNYVQFQPTSTNDLIHLTHHCQIECGNTDYGGDVYMMMKEGSASIGSSDTKLNYDGNHANYNHQGGDYRTVTKSFILPCTGLNTSSVYYLEQAGANHNSNAMKFNAVSSSASGTYRTHNVTLIHYKA